MQARHPSPVILTSQKPALPSLRALYPIWGEMAVIHFDAHLDSWNPRQWGGGINKYDELTHGTLLHFAHEEGLLKNDSGIHVGTRALLFDHTEDLRHDAECGFESVMATEIDRRDVGIDGVVKRIVDRVGNTPVYVTIDIDVLDAGELIPQVVLAVADEDRRSNIVHLQRSLQRRDALRLEDGRPGSL